MNKLAEVLDSKNARVSIISIVVLFLNVNNIYFDESAEDLYELFYGQNLYGILTVLIINFMGPLSKIWQKYITKQFDYKSLLKSSNFITQILTLLGIILAAYFNEATAGAIVAFLMHIITFIQHILEPTKHDNNINSGLPTDNDNVSLSDVDESISELEDH